MIPTGYYFFRYPGQDKPGTSTTPAESVEKKQEEEKFIRCRQCHQPLTRPSERISVEGTHAHTFANPSGILYEIGCFRSVIGCAYMGHPTDEFSWFKGFSWKVAYCNGCLTHLGWLFISTSGISFNGLILDCLTDPE
jgi:hypothetical protein